MLAFLMFTFVIFLIPLYLRTQMQVELIFSPINFAIFLMTLSALPGSILIWIYDDVYFNKVVNASRPENLELTVIILLSYSLFALYLFSFIERVPSKNDLIISKFNLIHLAVIIFIIALILGRLKIFSSLNNDNATQKFLIYRTMVSQSESGILYFLKYLFIDCIGWILALTLYQKKTLTKADKGYVYLVGFYFFASLTKSKLIIYIISLWVIRNRHKRISFFKLISLVFTVILMLVGTWFLLLDFDNLSYLYDPSSEGLVARIFISEISAFYTHIDYFSEAGAIGFASMSNFISGVFGLEHQIRSGEVIMQLLNPHWTKLGIKGTFNTHFLGEAYANFGIAGLVFAPIFVPLVILTYSSVALRLPLMYRYPVFVFLTFHLSVMSGINNYFYNPFLILVLITFIIGANLKRYVFSAF